MGTQKHARSGNVVVLKRAAAAAAPFARVRGGALPARAPWMDPDRPPDRDEPLDDCASLGIGRSTTFPLPQWRAHDLYRTVYFDEGRGKTVVFVHGLGANATHWEFIAPKLAGRCRVAGLDLVGCGWSRKPDIDYRVDTLRDHLLDFMERRRIRSATLVGHSLGGAVVTAAALAAPGMVESLALVCPAALGPLPLPLRLAARTLLYRDVVFPFLRHGADFILDNVFVDGAQQSRYVSWFHTMSLRDDPGFPHLRDFARVGTSLCRDVVGLDYSDSLTALGVPVLVILGDHDRLSSLSGVLGRLDGARRVRTVVIRRCGHMPMVERPEETLFHLERFLERPPL